MVVEKSKSYPVFDRNERRAKLKLHNDDDEITEIFPEPYYKKPSKYYSMKDRKHGIVLISKNRNFKPPKSPKSPVYGVREGTERDEHNLIQTFYFLGYRPVVYNDLARIQRNL